MRVIGADALRQPARLAERVQRAALAQRQRRAQAAHAECGTRADHQLAQVIRHARLAATARVDGHVVARGDEPAHLVDDEGLRQHGEAIEHEQQPHRDTR